MTIARSCSEWGPDRAKRSWVEEDGPIIFWIQVDKIRLKGNGYHPPPIGPYHGTTSEEIKYVLATNVWVGMRGIEALLVSLQPIRNDLKAFKSVLLLIARRRWFLRLFDFKCSSTSSRFVSSVKHVGWSIVSVIYVTNLLGVMLLVPVCIQQEDMGIRQPR